MTPPDMQRDEAKHRPPVAQAVSAAVRIAFAASIAVTAVEADPPATFAPIAWAVAAAALPDLPLVGRLLRSLAAIAAVGAFSAAVFPFAPQAAGILFVAFTLRVAQEWFLHPSRPLVPVDTVVVRLFDPRHTQRIWIDAVLASLLVPLWYGYLAGLL